jgi:hypothetical protein
MDDAEANDCSRVLLEAYEVMVQAAKAFNPRDLTVEERISLQESLIESAVKLKAMAERLTSR